jgi:transposase-like protein
MSDAPAFQAPPFCPNPRCKFHGDTDEPWAWVRAGFFRRASAPPRVQRFRCDHCGRYFSEQTFRTTYWLKRSELLLPVAEQLVQCAALRQIARPLHASPQTIALHAARLARHCLLFHQTLRPKGPHPEPLVLDGFQSFESSQYHPTWFHLVAGQRSHFFHGFTDSELRRSGAMTPAQRRRRADIEAARGRPDPRSIQREVARLLGIVASAPQALTLYSDQHPAYARALRELPHLRVTHVTISSRAARTPANPLAAINLLDLLIRHCSANHKRETIAFPKRRQCAAERLWIFLAWRNYIKWFSERRHDGTPAMRAGVCARRWSFAKVLAQRLFPARVPLPERWADYYWRRISSRDLPNCRTHALKYAA